jgi:hypothetical protein
MIIDITKIFCNFDDFCKNAEAQYQKEHPMETPDPWPSQLSLSEVMTICCLFHHINGFRNFKSFYTLYVSKNLRGYFPNLVSYGRFVELMKLAALPMYLFLHERTGKCTGIAFVDSRRIVVCHNKRINSHKVFKDLASRGKSSMGWFYGFKLHLIINEYGELLAISLTPGNIDDRAPVPTMTKGLWGKLFGDKGYISKQLTEMLMKNGLQLITPIKKNMKNKLIPLTDKMLLRKRSIIETVNDLLKNSCQIEHSRHRSPINFLVNMLSALIGYTYRDKLPEINFEKKEREFLTPDENTLYLAN